MLQLLHSFPQRRVRLGAAAASGAGPTSSSKIADQAPKSARFLKYKDIGSAWGVELFDGGAWRGYVGNWFLGVHEPTATRQLQGMRTRRWRDPSRRTVLEQTNVYSTPFMGSTTRSVDGATQADYEYSGKMFNQESSEELVSLKHAMIVPLGSGAHAWFSRFWLPPVAMDVAPGQAVPPAVLEAARAAEEGDPDAVQPIKSTNWSMEIFLKDGDCRWSVPLVYSSTTGALIQAAFIQEFATAADPATPHVLDAARAAVLEPRQQLPEDEASWLAATHGSVAAAAAARVGRRVARVWAAPGGGQQALLVDDAIEEPVQRDGSPSALDTSGASEQKALGGGHFLTIRLPDSMYIRVPKTVAAVAAVPSSLAAKGSAGSGGGIHCGSVLRFEFGGLLRSPPAGNGRGTLARVVIQYDRTTGSFMDVCHDVFVPPPQKQSLHA